MKGYFTAKNSFVVEVTFNDLLVEVILKTFYPVCFFSGSYKPSTHLYPLTHPHLAKKRSRSPTPTHYGMHTQLKKDHTHQHPPTPTKKSSYPNKCSHKSTEKKIFLHPLLGQLAKQIYQSETQEVLNIIFAKYNVRQVAFQYNMEQMTSQLLP